MSETKTSTARRKGSSNQPFTGTSGTGREFAQQAALAKDVSDTTRATADETNKTFGDK